jgi:hypothetical protein
MTLEEAVAVALSYQKKKRLDGLRIGAKNNASNTKLIEYMSYVHYYVKPKKYTMKYDS